MDASIRPRPHANQARHRQRRRDRFQRYPGTRRLTGTAPNRPRRQPGCLIPLNAILLTETTHSYSEAIKTASDTTDTVSKKDLQIELAPIRTDLTLMKWMLGLIVAGVAALVLKSFF